jgi:hypothetical protein
MFDSGGRRPQIIVRTRRREAFFTTGLVPFASPPQLAHCASHHQRRIELEPRNLAAPRRLNRRRSAVEPTCELEEMLCVLPDMRRGHRGQHRCGEDFRSGEGQNRTGDTTIFSTAPP